MEKINLETMPEHTDRAQTSYLAVVKELKCINDLPSQVMVEGFVIALILNGIVKISVENQELTMKRGDIFACNPRNILEHAMISVDFQILALFATPEYAQKLLGRLDTDWSFLLIGQNHNILHADDQQMDRLADYLNLLYEKLQAPDTPHKQKSIEYLILSFGMELIDMHDKQCPNAVQLNYGPADNLVQRFLQMLSESSIQDKPYLNVNGYAERLNVTPKYFSLVCKNKIGKPASEIISESIMTTARTLLHDNSHSIKQIAERLGFANQSHFGTFFRRHSGGTSPQDYRKNGE